jgi:uncharacterized protein (TIGR00369 family)
MGTMLELAQKMIRGEIPPAPVATLIGFRLVMVEKGTAVMTLDADERHTNPMGTLHGGILCDIADAAMGIAYASLLDEGESFTTLELKMNFLKPIWKASLLAEGKVVRAGRTVGLVECTVTDQKGDLIARASSTCMTLHGEMARGR